MAFKESTTCFSPNGFSTLQRQLKDESRGLGLRPALALLRLSQFDPDVFYKLKQVRDLLFRPFRTCVSMYVNEMISSFPPGRQQYVVDGTLKSEQ